MLRSIHYSTENAGPEDLVSASSNEKRSDCSPARFSNHDSKAHSLAVTDWTR